MKTPNNNDDYELRDEYDLSKMKVVELNLTPEEITELGKEWGEAMLAGLPFDDMLSRYGKKEWLSRFTMDELLSQFSAEEIKSYLEKLKQKQQK